MERYDYREAVRADVVEWLNENDDIIPAFFDDGILDECALADRMDDLLWADDSVTGNGSGSYFCNAWRAEEAICHNLDLLAEAIEEFGGDMDVMKDGAEACDVTIRCYLLYSVVQDVVNELATEVENLTDAGHDTEFALCCALASLG